MNQYVFPIPEINWIAASPVIIMSIGGILGLLLEMLRPHKDNGAIIWGSCLMMVVTLGSLFMQYPFAFEETFGGMIYQDRFGILMQMLMVLVCLATVLMSESYLREKRIPFGEFYPLVMWATAGAMIMVSSKSLLMLFLGLEVLSISLYVLAGMSKHESKSEESAIKYFLLGAFASAFLLYGIAMIYGATGSLHLDRIALAASSNQDIVRIPLVFGVCMVLIGLFFKAAFVPFHQWTPDVYQGAPTNVTAFMAAASKVAAIGMLVRVLDASIALQNVWMPILYVVAIATMLVGNILACLQTDVKRILGYSSIANAGYVLVALIAHFRAPDKISLMGVFFFLLIYCAVTIGSFAILTLVARDGQENTKLSDLNGLKNRNMFLATMLALMGLTMAGAPILPSGFLAKLLIFKDAIDVGMAPLAAVMAVASVISIYYYFGIVKASFVNAEDTESNVPMSKASPGIYGVTIACVLILGLAWLGIDRITNDLSVEGDILMGSMQQDTIIQASNK